MAASAYLIYQDGKLEVPEELQREWHLKGGERLQVVCASQENSRVASELAKNIRDIDWSVFEGCLADLDVDLNAELEKERIRENELDARH